MGLTVSKLSQDDIGLGEIIVADVTFGSSYPAGGEPISARDLGFRVGSELRSVATSQEGVRAFEYEADANLGDRGKFLVYEETAGVLAEVSPGTDLSAVTVRVTVVGR